MRLKKIVKDIQDKVNFLAKDNYHKAKKYEEQQELLKNIKLKVKKTNLFLNNDGQVGVNIEYEVPKVKIYFDDDGEIIKNEKFYAINSLDLISNEDMQNVAAIIEEATRRNKK